MAGSHEEACDFDFDLLRQGRNLLWAALVGAIVSLPALLSGKAATLAMLAWIISFLGGAVGISYVARAFNSGVIIKYAGIISAMMPGWNCLPIGFFLYKATRSINEEGTASVLEAAARRIAARESEDRPQAAPVRPAVAVPASDGNAKAKERVARAIAQVKIAGLANLPEGTRLEAKISAPGFDIPDDDQPIFMAAKGIFGVAYVIDNGNSYTHVTQGQVRAAGMTLGELHQIGLRNLAVLLNENKQKLKLSPLKNSYGLLFDDHFEASLVLLDQLWDGALKKFLPTAPVVALPSRDVCAFCDAGSAEGIRELRGVSERVSQGGDHLISPLLFIRKDGKWEEFKAA